VRRRKGRQPNSFRQGAHTPATLADPASRAQAQTGPIRPRATTARSPRKTISRQGTLQPAVRQVWSSERSGGGAIAAATGWGVGVAVGDGVSVNVGVKEGARTGMALAGGGGATLAANTSRVGVGVGGMYVRRNGVLVGGGGVAFSVSVCGGGGGWGVSGGEGGGGGADAAGEGADGDATGEPGGAEAPGEPDAGADAAGEPAGSTVRLGAGELPAVGVNLGGVSVWLGDTVGPTEPVEVCAWAKSGLPSIDSSAAAPRRTSVRRSSNTRS